MSGEKAKSALRILVETHGAVQVVYDGCDGFKAYIVNQPKEMFYGVSPELACKALLTYHHRRAVGVATDTRFGSHLQRIADKREKRKQTADTV